MIQKISKIKEEYNLEDVEVKSSFIAANCKSVDLVERSVLKYVTKPTLDRSKEIVISQGIDLTDFQKNPVILYAHNYGNNWLDIGSSQLPIGKDMWIKFDKEGGGLLAKQTYAHHQLAEDIFEMHKDGFPLASSIGFIPTKTIMRGSFEDKEWKNEILRLSETYGIDKKNFEFARVIYENSLLLEHSDCPVGDNPDALALAIKSGKVSFKSEELQFAFESIILKADITLLNTKIEQLEDDSKIMRAMLSEIEIDRSSNKTVTIDRAYIQDRIVKTLQKEINKMFGTC